MKKGLTEMVFIIDKSGSMEGLEKDTIGGFNSMLKEQQAVEGEAVVTTVLFDNRYELLHDRIDIRAVSPLTEKNYTVGGNTALLDALGKTIRKIREVQERTAEVFLPKISNPSLLNFVDRIGFKMIPVEKYRKLQTEEKGIRKVFS